jgi:hypothetical protein
VVHGVKQVNLPWAEKEKSVHASVRTICDRCPAGDTDGHGHIHVLITCGAFSPEGDFLEFPEFDRERLLVAWQQKVFTLYLAEEKIEREVVENRRSWEHSGFSVDQSVFLPAGDQAGKDQSQLTLISSLSNLANSAPWGTPGQMQSDSDKTYGPDDTDFLRHQTYGNSGTVVRSNNGGFLTERSNV